MWQAIGIGRSQLPLLVCRIGDGRQHPGGLRGQRLLQKGELAESNAQFVRRAVELVGASGREVATPDDVRERLGVR